MKAYVLILLFNLMAHFAWTQNFQNGDLEGKVYGFYSLPQEWEAVLYTDEICQATSAITASPDLTSNSEPSIDQGIIGIPYSGTTFVSGLDAFWILGNDTIRWHEGIQQTVSGFETNTTYSISFYQAVVKQIIQEADGAVIDTSGSWAVFVDDVLLGVSTPSHSLLAYNNTNLNWEYRSIPFSPGRVTHTFKFFPLDDDNDRNSNGPNGRLRMGIDQISINLTTSIRSPEIIPVNAVFPNPTDGKLHIQLDESYPSLRLDIFDRSGKIVAHYEFSGTHNLELEIPGPPGLYLVQVTIDQQNKRTFRIIKH